MGEVWVRWVRWVRDELGMKRNSERYVQGKNVRKQNEQYGQHHTVLARTTIYLRR